MLSKIEKINHGIQFFNLFDIKDKKTLRKLYQLLLGKSEDKGGTKLVSLMDDAHFNSVLKELLDNDFLGRDIEWVLVIPLGKYLKNSQNCYELIFGRGQEINEKDLFLSWKHTTKKVQVTNFHFDEGKRDVMSLYEVENLTTGYGLGKDTHPHEKISRYATIENIKECLDVRLEQKFKSVLISKNHKDLLLKPEHLKTQFRYLNVVINLIKGACVILLKDVFDVRYSFHLKGARNSFDYDSYTVVRSFLKSIGLYPERRSGLEKRLRISNDDWENIRRTIEEDKKNVKEIFSLPKDKIKTKSLKLDYIKRVVSQCESFPQVTLTRHHEAKLIAFLQKYL